MIVLKFNGMYPKGPQYKAPAEDDRRVQWCPSCENNVRTVPGEGVVNQALRCCEWCGSYTDEERTIE